MTRCSDCTFLFPQSQRVERGPLRRLPVECVRLVLEHAVTGVFMIPGCELWSDRRGNRRVAFARQVAMYLAHVVCGLTLPEVGALFARDRTTVAHACGLIEDRRDDPGFDRALDLLEGVLRLLSPPPVRSFFTFARA